jgi:Starch binding domain
MQRWTFLEKKLVQEGSVADEVVSEEEAAERFHEFRVKVQGTLKKSEVVGLTGDSSGLGDWNLDSCVLLQPPDMDGVEYWHAEVAIPSQTLVHYRYFICTVDEKGAVRAIHSQTSTLTLKEAVDECRIDNFEETCGDRGWLLCDSAIQFRIDHGSIELDKPPKNREMRLHCSTIPIDESQKLEESSVEVMEAGKFKLQPQFGVQVDPRDHILFELRIFEPQKLVYLLNFYTFRSEGSPPCHYGYAWILPETIAGVQGFIKATIFCATKHRMLGSLVVEFVHVKPLSNHVRMVPKSSESYAQNLISGAAPRVL